jgi:hypothetical protein
VWLVGGLAMTLAFHLVDRAAVPRPGRLFDRSDWLAMGGLLLAGFVVRAWNLTWEAPAAAGDEMLPFSFLLQMRGQGSPFGLGQTAMLLLFYYVHGFFRALLEWFGFETLLAVKLPGAFWGALSIAALYASARLFAPAAVALAAGVFLLWQGWHWILSRLLYLYAGDLAWISLTTALLLCGVRARRRSLLALAGFTTALGVCWFKTAVMTAPWAVVILGDYVLTERRTRRLALAWLMTFLVSIAPLATQIGRAPDVLWRFRDLTRARVVTLEHMGLTSTEGYYWGFLRAFTILQVRELHDYRHAVRVEGPALDWVLSTTATIGFVSCLIAFFRDRAARLCVLGFLLFLVPAVASYPENDLHSRRMIGGSLFLSWAAARGAALVAARLFASRWQPRAVLALAAVSMVLNFFYVRGYYVTNYEGWYSGEHVNVARLIAVLRQGATVGPVFFRETAMTGLVRGGVIDLPNVTVVQTVEELRAQLNAHRGELCVVVLPWDTPHDRADSAEWVPALSDLIPPYLWDVGGRDARGVPFYRMAHVRLPREAAPPSGTPPAAP